MSSFAASSKSAKIWLSKSIFYVNHLNLSDFFFNQEYLLRNSFSNNFIFKPLHLLKSYTEFLTRPQLVCKASEYVYNWLLILFNLLNKWIAKGVTYNPHDFTRQYTVFFFVSHYFAKWKTLFFPVPTPTSKEMNLSKMIKWQRDCEITSFFSIFLKNELHSGLDLLCLQRSLSNV